LDKLLVVEDLKTHFFIRRGVIKAVDGVTFSLGRGESLGLVGESGSGKSMMCLSILRLVPQPAGRIVGGSIRFEGDNLLDKTEREMRYIRGGKIALIPQDPMTSLDPTFSVWSQLSERLRLHRGLSGKPLWDRSVELLRQVRIPSPEERLHAYPHQLSGGMRQRVIGAMALGCEPSLLIADEPTTALDVTIQAQYLLLLREMRDRLGAGLIFVTHDLGIVECMCDRVAVMYAGKIVEEAPVTSIFADARHPYTRALLKSVPRLGERSERLTAIEGQPPDLARLPTGCAFRPRCPIRVGLCEEYPPLAQFEGGHRAACWLAK